MIPEPDQTPDGPRYEGRVLPRPDDEVVDQGAAFDLQTLVSRRRMLGLVGIGLGTAALAACAPTATATPSATATATASASATPTPSATASAAATALPAGEIPDETAGPYPGDGSNGPDVLEQSGIVRRDIRTSLGGTTPVDGVPLEFTLRLTDMANGDAAFAGVAVYAWHCDAQGRYSMYSDGVEDESFLRGVQIADADGQVTFTSVMPGCYAGRWTHIHFEVYPTEADITDAGNAIATSQLAFPQSVLDPVYALPAYDGSARNLSQITLASDNVFGEDGGALQLATVTGDATNGYAASLVVRVDTTTTPSAGAAPGGGGRP
ncbi:intradiol ring-cleavage dioxygenase [Microbacterium telephonicum]|uniref:Protocatechuate 3,4-dioxygenase beta subunit n=1 Tax=Microbacterium telephonicum TaxID=1714841 RepID=A0A498C997_9MICO|nr:intradiol ring-cleavage dioxygenase [Microbacterium telephonicum]RLK52312.1 protocatechuate 3,4-dioxygenase beta subunit [Microbacterium telephonicum]